jgi:hypothetical protein
MRRVNISSTCGKAFEFGHTMIGVADGRVRVSFISKTKFYETCLTRRLIQSQELSSLKPVRGRRTITEAI